MHLLTQGLIHCVAFVGNTWQPTPDKWYFLINNKTFTYVSTSQKNQYRQEKCPKHFPDQFCHFADSYLLKEKQVKWWKAGVNPSEHICQRGDSIGDPDVYRQLFLQRKQLLDWRRRVCFTAELQLIPCQPQAKASWFNAPRFSVQVRFVKNGDICACRDVMYIHCSH